MVPDATSATAAAARWLAGAALAATVRAAAGVPVAAVLVARRPAGRHPARLQDRPGPGRPLGRAGARRAERGDVAAGEGPGHRGQRAARRRRRPRALAARGDEVTVLQRRPAGLALPEVLADVADLDAVRAAVAGTGRGGPPGRQGQRHRTLARTTARANVVGHRATWSRPAGAAGGAAAGARLVAVGGPRRHVPGRSRRRTRPTPSTPAAPTPAARRVAEQLALAADSRPTSRSSRSGRTSSGDRATPSWSAGSSIAPAAGRLPLIGSGAALIDTHLRRQCRRRAGRGPRPLRRRPRPGAGGVATASPGRSPSCSARSAPRPGSPGRPHRTLPARPARAAGGWSPAAGLGRAERRRWTPRAATRR